MGLKNRVEMKAEPSVDQWGMNQATGDSKAAASSPDAGKGLEKRKLP